MYKIGVIGDYDSICGFAALGLDIYPVEDIEKAKDSLTRLAERGYGIIYVTEQYLSRMQEEQDLYREKQIPAIIAIPSVRENLGMGRAALKRYVEQAVGSDIIFNEE
ncbi:MAG: V-type ATP synthase subunit F [Clostridia bacterium]|nr:V-type ATP synthase subunit F [Clostridia bacterium]